MNKHFYLVFNPFLDSNVEEYTQAHRFYFDLKKAKKKDPKATRYWGKISKSKKDPLNISDFKEISLSNESTYLFISDYRFLWVGKIKSIETERPKQGLYDDIYNAHDVEIWFEVEDFTIIENSQKSCAERLSQFSCYQDGELYSDSLSNYQSGMRFPVIIEDSKNELFFSENRIEVLEESSLINANISQKIINSIISYCIPEKVFQSMPHSAKEEIIKAEIELHDNRIYNLNSIAFSYLKGLESVVNDVFKKAVLSSTSYNKIWFCKRSNRISTRKENESDVAFIDVKTNFSLVSIFKFLKDAHFNNCLITKGAFERSPKLQFFLGKELNDISFQLDLINLRNKLAHDSDFTISKEEFYALRSSILGHAQAGLINKLYKSYDRELFLNILPNNSKEAA